MINFQSNFHSKRLAIRDSGPPYGAIRDPKVSKTKNSPHATGGGAPQEGPCRPWYSKEFHDSATVGRSGGPRDVIFEPFSEIAQLRGAFLRQKPKGCARYTVWRYTRKSGFPV